MKVSVKVKTRARAEKVVEVGENCFEVWVRALPKKGKANEAVIKLLAKHFKISQDNIKIITGKASKQKIVEIGIPD